VRILAAFGELLRIPEVRRRIAWTLGLLAAYRVGSHVPLPGVNPSAVATFLEDASRTLGSAWAFLDLFTGGALGKLSLFSLGIMPYITASIIVQLLAKASGKLEAIVREGTAGRRVLNRITRHVTVGVAVLQAAFTTTQLDGILIDPGLLPRGVLVAGMTAGALLSLWIGEEISERGLGNGPSVLVMAGIAVRLPAVLAEMAWRWRKGDLGFEAIPFVLAAFLAAVIAVVFVTQAQRRIPLQHPKQIRGRRISIGGTSYLPLRLNSAGVMPLIFASSFFVLPQLLASLPGLGWVAAPLKDPFLATLLQIVLILFFSYYWTYLTFRPDEMALQLKENGSFVPGIRPGEQTARHLNHILARLTLAGGAFLGVLAVGPGLVGRAVGLESYLDEFLGGSAVLIAVGVALDLSQKLESYLHLHRYEGFLGRRKS
jgi:preprotein translocase subunit SecY